MILERLPPHVPAMATWSDRANQGLTRKGWSKAELQRRTGLAKDALYKQLDGKVAQPRGETMAKIARTLGVHHYWLVHGTGPRFATVPLVGEVGAGEEFYPINDYSEGAGQDEIPVNFDVADPIAIRVKGHSMAPVYRHGDDLFCSRMRGADWRAAIGRDCIVMTVDGRGYIKQLRQNRDGNPVLRSYNATFEDIEDFDLEWVAPVILIRRN